MISLLIGCDEPLGRSPAFLFIMSRVQRKVCIQPLRIVQTRLESVVAQLPCPVYLYNYFSLTTVNTLTDLLAPLFLMVSILPHLPHPLTLFHLCSSLAQSKPRHKVWTPRLSVCYLLEREWWSTD